MRAARRISASVPGRARDRDQHALARLPRLGDVVALAVALEPLVDAVGEPQQRELAQRGEVARPEVVRERGVDAIRLVDVAVRHPAAQRFRRHVDELDLVGAAHDVVGDRLALLHAGDPLDHVVHRLEVLDVERRDHVDAGLEQLLDVLPALLVHRPRDVRVRELVDEHDVGPAGERPRSTSISSNSVPAVLEPAGGERPPDRRSARPCAARPWVSTTPTTTSVPRSWRRRPSLSMAKVLPTPGAAPRYKRSWPRVTPTVCRNPGSGAAMGAPTSARRRPGRRCRQ